jgi:hypothetical protein
VGAAVTLTLDDAAQLCGRLAALSRAGLLTGRLWPVLAQGRGPAAEVASTVAAMTLVGGSAADGLRLASTRVQGDGVEALRWLATACEVIERSGAPAALVLDRIGEGLLAEIARADERAVALAGPQATATVLTCLPLAGLVLAPILGIDPLGALAGTWVGRVCAATGGALWLIGRWWTARLVAHAARSRSGRPERGKCHPEQGKCHPEQGMSRRLRALVRPRSGDDGPDPRAVPDVLPGPLVLDLIAAVLAGGGAPATALRSVAAALQNGDDPRGDALLQIAGALADPEPIDPSPSEMDPHTRRYARRGIPRSASPSDIDQDTCPYTRRGIPRTASPSETADELMAVLEEELLMAVRSGLPPADLLRRAAAEARRRRAAEQRRAVHRLEVLLVIPAGICLLPAFVLLGIVPIVLDLVHG